jgi:hypothetical protein
MRQDTAPSPFICDFCLLVDDLIAEFHMEPQDWRLFFAHLRLAHGWVEEVEP